MADVSNNEPVNALPASTRDKVTWKHALVFVLAILIFAGLDLGLKYWSFASVADQPLILKPDPADGSTRIYILETGSPVELPRQIPSEPSSAIPYHEGIGVVPYLLKFELVLNTGAVFGLGKGGQSFFIIFSLVALVVIGYFFSRIDRKAHWLQAGMALIAAGAIGNLYDRFFYGSVRDMLKLFPDVMLPWGYHWPQAMGGSAELYPWVFNLADAELLVGVGIVMVVTWINDMKRQKPQPKAK